MRVGEKGGVSKGSDKGIASKDGGKQGSRKVKKGASKLVGKG